ncbi:CLUMA_CG010490, isoform A [Clunio marinus]|uniref:CLUMA_CG010490, isoform A n=1 Tax=Clunio marinus TaxID=568069 RepID=A0A1J1I9X7_9DIPT|nr:CLUMA_CG010490, isoform A [Clunio marinus]
MSKRKQSVAHIFQIDWRQSILICLCRPIGEVANDVSKKNYAIILFWKKESETEADLELEMMDENAMPMNNATINKRQKVDKGMLEHTIFKARNNQSHYECLSNHLNKRLELKFIRSLETHKFMLQGKEKFSDICEVFHMNEFYHDEISSAKVRENFPNLNGLNIL